MRGRAYRWGMAIPPSKVDPGFITAVVAIGCVSSLIVLTVFGIFEMLPPWAGVLIVVFELLTPAFVYWATKRARKG